MEFGQDDEIVLVPAFGQDDEVIQTPPRPVPAEVTFGQNDEILQTPTQQTQSPAFNRESKLVDPTGRPIAPDKNPLLENGTITREQILKDPKYMKIIRDGMQARFGVGNRNSYAGDFRYEEDWDDEKLFEMWQNYQRSFAAGQTVTTGNEAAYLMRADNDQKGKVGQMYMLFDAMPNVFSSDTSWSDTFDSFWDYGKANIWDPTTAAGLGVGRLWSKAGAKAGGTALRETVKRVGMSGLKTTAEKAGQTLGAGLAYTGVDIVQAVGTDMAYQDALIDTGAQTEYSGAQTALSAAGVLVLPSLIAGSKGIAALRSTKGAEKIGADKYLDIVDTLGEQRTPENVKKALYEKMDMGKVAGGMSNVMKRFMDDKESFLPWTEAKEEAVKRGLVTATVGDDESTFFRALLLGSPDGKTNGLYKELADAGFVYIERFEDDKFTNFVGDIIADLPKYAPEQAKKLNRQLKTISKSNPQIKSMLEQGADDPLGNFSLYFKKRTSNIARDLWIQKRGKELMTTDYTKLTNKKLIKLLQETGDAEKSPGVLDKVRWSQNIYKRLLTSHPGTTGLNVKGWGLTAALNNVSDVVEAGLFATRGGMKFVVGANDGARMDMRQASGSFMGAMKRGLNFTNAANTEEAAMKYFEVRPKAAEELFRWRSGSVEAGSAAKNLGLDENAPVYKNTEKVTSAIQAISGVQLQDDITKRLSFMTALEQEVMKEYGMSYNKFIGSDNAYVEMFTPKFHQVEARAIDRALRETYSKSFTKGGDQQRFWRIGAREMERISNLPGVGYYIPFGQFFNNSIATFGDYSGVNFARHLLAKGLGHEIDLTEEAGTALLSKGIVGITAAAMIGDKAVDKISQGLAWNQEERSDGSIKDVTYEFPESLFRIVGQIVGHHMRDETPPADLMEEFFEISYGQTFRQIGEAGTSVEDVMTAIGRLEQGRTLEVAKSILSGIVSRPISGATRFLDPINEATILLKQDFEEIDRRQGYEWFNNSVRYIDQIPKLFGGQSLVESFNEGRGEEPPEVRYDPVKRTRPHDPGRVLGGERSASAIKPFESMMNSVGTRSWKQIRWDGPAKLKNHLDRIIEPYLNHHAATVLREVDFFNLPVRERQRWTSIVAEKARADVKVALAGTFSEQDVQFQKLKEVYGYTHEDILWATELFGFKGKPEDWVGQDSRKLDILLDALENKDTYMNIRSFDK